MHLALLLSLGSAIAFGISDYLAGLYSRRTSILSLLIVAHVVGLAVLLVTVALLPVAEVGWLDAGLGAVGGIAAAFGLLLLVHGFRVGMLSVVSPVSALGAAGIPVIVGLLLGEEPSRPALIGLFTGLVAIWLVSSGAPDVRSGARSFAAGFWSGMAAGVCFAATLLALPAAGAGSGIWPVVAMQGALVAVIAGALLVRRQRVSLALEAVPGVAMIGITGTLGVLLYLFAARAGLVSIAAVIASMSPAVTVILARMFMHEALSYRQITGLITAAIALALISAN